MTVREYMSDKLKAFGITEAQLVDVYLATGISLDADVTSLPQQKVGVALANTLEELVLAPRMANVSESGFSVSWDFSLVSQYYLWLCRKWGLTPNAEVLSAMGLSVISDKSSKW